MANWVSIFDAGSLGVSRDRDPKDLPPEMLSDVKNMRLLDGKLISAQGYASVGGTPSIEPYFLMGVPTQTDSFMLYAGLTKVYAMLGMTHKEITKAATTYLTRANTGWNGTLFFGIPVINNSWDPPQVWSPVDFTTPQKLTDLPNWPASTLCRVMRSFKNYLVALNVTKGANVHPYMLKWSHPADPGSLPSSWDETDPAIDAGEVDVGDTPGYLMDCLPYGDVNIIYKEDAVHGQQAIGGTDIFRFFDISKEIGLVATRAVANTPVGQVFLSSNDLALTDGRSPQSLLDRKLRRWLENNLDQDNVSKAFAVHNRKRTEVWCCIPVSSTFPNIAIVWNYTDNTITFRDLPNVAHITPASINPAASGDPWDSDSGTWDTDTTLWDNRDVGLTNPNLWMAIPGTNKKIVQVDTTNTADGTAIATRAERTSLSIVGRDRQGNPRADLNSIKLVRGFRPRIRASSHVIVYLAQQDTLDADDVTWRGPFSFDPNSEQELDFEPYPTRLPGFRIEGQGDMSWELTALDMDIEVISEF